MDEWGPDSSRTPVMCAWIQIRSIIDSACLAADQSFYHATKMHWWRKIQLWWHPPNVPISFSSHLFLFVFTFIFFHLTLYLSTSLCLSLWDAFFEQGNEGRRSIGCQTHRRRRGKWLWRGGERVRQTLLQEEYKHISSQQTAFHRPRSSTLHHTGLQAKQR